MRRIKFRKPYKLKNYRFGLVALVLVLSIIGILVVGSANESYQSKQIFGVVIGLVVMAIVSLMYGLRTSTGSCMECQYLCLQLY